MAAPHPPSLLALLQQLAGAIDALGLRYAFIGAMARNAWARPRTTMDLDLEITLNARTLETLDAALRKLDIQRESEIGPAEATDEVPDNLVYRCASGVRVDVLVTKTGFQDRALERRVRHSILGVDAWVITCEDSIVYKLIAGRSQDNADIEAMLDAQDNIDWPYVEEWAAAWGVSDRLRAFADRWRTKNAVQ